jgi:lauroyl/myristoyl acyltransferase
VTWRWADAVTSFFTMISLIKRLTLEQKDVLRAVGMMAGYLPTILIPRPVQTWLIDRLTGLAFRLRPGKVSAFAERMSQSLGPRAEGRDLTSEARNHYQAIAEGSWARIQNLRKDGWKPEISVEGMEWIEAGQAAGAGTVLWRMPFGTTMTVKVGLWRQGVPLVHLSMEHHGAFSPKGVARDTLCAMFRRTERWYLAERVIIPEDGSTVGVMKTLMDRLRKDNAVVSIVGHRLATQNIQTPFLDGWARFALGAPSLAWKTGSLLLPVFAIREDTGRYRVVIDEPISVDRELDRKTFVRKATEEFSERMQDAIARSPGSWRDWGQLWTRTGVYRPPLDEETGRD